MMRKYEHGGDVYSREILYDFSANINPLGMPGQVRAAIINGIDSYERYPDPNCTKLIGMLSRHEGVSAEQIVCGSGAADLIYRLVSALRPKRGLVCAPAFCEYEKAMEENGCQVTYHYLEEACQFDLTERILGQLTGNMDICFLGNPNNPVGNTIDPGLMKQIAACCLETGITLAVDECFLDFTENGADRSAIHYINPRVIVLKAFTKSHAMAGLRLGYAVCGDPETAAAVRKRGQCWSVSGPAQAAGMAALSDDGGYLKKTRKLVGKERNYLAAELKKLGFPTYPAEANFLLFRDPKGRPIDELLLKEKLAVRSCADYEGLSSDYYRIAVRTHEENQYLMKMMKRVLCEPDFCAEDIL